MTPLLWLNLAFNAVLVFILARHLRLIHMRLAALERPWHVLHQPETKIDDVRWQPYHRTSDPDIG